MPFTGLFTNGNLKTLISVISIATAIVMTTLYFAGLDKNTVVGDTTINGKLETLQSSNLLEHNRLDKNIESHRTNEQAHNLSKNFMPRIELDVRLKAIETILIKQDDKLDELLQRK